VNRGVLSYLFSGNSRRPESSGSSTGTGARLNGATKQGVHEIGLGTILLIVLILMLLGVLPTWPHSRGWGYGPTGIIGIVLLVLVILLLMGKI
jgi:hypothetical protein